MTYRLATIRKKLLGDIEKLRAPGGYLNAGYPNYNDLFGRDSLISAWQILAIDPSIARSTLSILAQYQATKHDKRKDAEPGKILHEYRFDPKRQKELPFWGWPYYGSVDSTSWFVIVAGLYFRKTRDRIFLQKLWPNVHKAMLWHIRFGDKDRDGLIEYQRKNPRGLYHQGWKDNFADHLKMRSPAAIVEEQGYFYRALREFAYLTQMLGRDRRLGRAMRTRARALKRKFNQAFWMPEEKFYALGLDAAKRQRRAVTSNPGHLLFTGILSESRQRAAVERLFRPDMFTRFGVRTLSRFDPDFDQKSYHLGSVWPHDNWIIWQGLRQCGFRTHAQRIKAALFCAYHTLGCIPELYGVVKDKAGRDKIMLLGKVLVKEKNHHLASASANPVQAWAAAGLLNMFSEAS